MTTSASLAAAFLTAARFGFGQPQRAEVLDFCAEHGIGAEVEFISADQVNEAFARVPALAYVPGRFVVDTATLA